MRIHNLVKEYIEGKGGQLLSDFEIKSNMNFTWKCNNEHINNSSHQIVKRGSWCTQCKKEVTKNKAIQNLNKDLTLLQFSYPKSTMVCKNNHIIQMTTSHMIEGNGCGICYKHGLNNRKQKLSIEDIKNRLKSVGFTFLDSVYTNLSKPYSLQCKKGHKFTKKIGNIMLGIVGCPQCNNYFKSENKLRKSIEHLFNLPFPKSRPDWLVNPETNYKMELDCYNAELRLAFEYDGQFHFEIRKGINNDLEGTKKRDKLKEQLCIENNVNLIRVPYFLDDKQRYEKIIEGIKIVYGTDYWKIFRHLEETLKGEQTTLSNEQLQKLLEQRQAARNSIVE